MAKRGSRLFKDVYPEVFATFNREMTAEHFPDVDLDTLTTGSRKIVSRDCVKDPRHGYWNQIVSHAGNGSGCPRCSTQKPTYTVNDLASTHWNVVMAMDMERTLEKYPGTDEGYFFGLRAGSPKPLVFTCHDCGKPYTRRLAHAVKSVTALGRSRCPGCVKWVTEDSFRRWTWTYLKAPTVSTRISLRRPAPFKTGRMQVDGLCAEKNVVVEFDGKWSHGGMANSPKPLADALLRDTVSTRALLAAGYHVIRVRESPLPLLDIGSGEALSSYAVGLSAEAERAGSVQWGVSHPLAAEDPCVWGDGDSGIVVTGHGAANSDDPESVHRDAADRGAGYGALVQVRYDEAVAPTYTRGGEPWEGLGRLETYRWALTFAAVTVLERSGAMTG